MAVNGRLARALPKIQRYAIAGLGPISGAVAQFTLSLLLLRLLSPAQFGSFSFLLITSLFVTGIWSSLFCAPLPVLLNRLPEAERASFMRCIFGVNISAALVACVMFVGIGLALGVPLIASILFAIFVAGFLLRWFARAYFYAVGDRLRTMRSDLIYAGTLLTGIAVLALFEITSVRMAYAIMMISVLIGLLPFGLSYLKRQFGSFYLRAFIDYLPIWRSHSGWSFMGVITTEATVNSHVYIVTLIAGPAAYAPIAATALMIRPIGVLQNALVEYERAQMAIDLAAGKIAAVFRSVTHFRFMLLAILIATASAVTVMLMFAPRLIFPPEYAIETLVTGAALWMTVAGVRLIRTPEAAMLQAAGEFRKLAWASAGACGFSIVSVLTLMQLYGPIWSIAGVIIGETAFGLWIMRQSQRWRAEIDNAPDAPVLDETPPDHNDPASTPAAEPYETAQRPLS